MWWKMSNRHTSCTGVTLRTDVRMIFGGITEVMSAHDRLFCYRGRAKRNFTKKSMRSTMHLVVKKINPERHLTI